MSLLSIKDDDGDSTTGKSLRDIASVVGQRLETDRRSPLPQEGHNVEGDGERTVILLNTLWSTFLRLVKDREINDNGASTTATAIFPSCY